MFIRLYLIFWVCISFLEAQEKDNLQLLIKEVNNLNKEVYEYLKDSQNKKSRSIPIKIGLHKTSGNKEFYSYQYVFHAIYENNKLNKFILHYEKLDNSSYITTQRRFIVDNVLQDISKNITIELNEWSLTDANNIDMPAESPTIIPLVPPQTRKLTFKLDNFPTKKQKYELLLDYRKIVLEVYHKLYNTTQIKGKKDLKKILNFKK